MEKMNSVHKSTCRILPKKTSKRGRRNLLKPGPIEQRFFEKQMVYDVPLGAGRAYKIMTRGPRKVTTQLSY